MVYRTFDDLKTQLEKELDTEDETFYQPAEIVNYFNSAVTIAEAEIVKLGMRDKYLQKEAFVSTVAGTSDYNLPSDCVATKIRKITYRNGTLVYTVHPLRSENGYEVEDVMSLYPPNEYYHYSIYKMGSGNSYVMRITPKALLSVTNAFRIIYWSSLNRYTAEGDGVFCDLPAICYEYIMAYVRYRIYAKESHVNTADEKQNVEAFRQLMNETLQNQAADPEWDQMEADISHYEEMS